VSQLLEYAATGRNQNEKAVWLTSEWVMFCAKTIEAQAPDFWKDLLSSVENRVGKYGLSAQSFQKTLPTQFFVHRGKLPALTVAVDLDIPAHTVRYVTVRRPNREVDESRAERRMVFHLDDAGELYLKQGDAILNVDDAAELLLFPFAK
jgi:hypothetical protein